MASPGGITAALAASESAPKSPVKVVGPLGSNSSPPTDLFHGPTRFYFSPACPYAQRVAIAVRFKELNDFEWWEINLSDKPSWYKDQVYPLGKVPALEHEGKVVGESLDLLRYLDTHFGGPPILPEGKEKEEDASKFLELMDAVVRGGFSALSSNYKPEDPTAAAQNVEETFGPTLDKIEAALSKYSAEGPFFLGSFSYVDAAFAPFLERFHANFKHFIAADIAKGRPHFQTWIDAITVLPAYSSTRLSTEKLVDIYQRMLDSRYFERIGLASTAK